MSYTLHDAVEQKSLGLMTLLLNNGADANATNQLGQTPLHTLLLNSGLRGRMHGYNFATGKDLSEIEFIELLVSKGANINAQNKKGNTPLHLACRFNRADIVEDLLSKGADIELKNVDGHTPMDLVSTHDIDMFELFSRVLSKAEYADFERKVFEKEREKLEFEKMLRSRQPGYVNIHSLPYSRLAGSMPRPPTSFAAPGTVNIHNLPYSRLANPDGAGSSAPAANGSVKKGGYTKHRRNKHRRTMKRQSKRK